MRQNTKFSASVTGGLELETGHLGAWDRVPQSWGLCSVTLMPELARGGLCVYL